MNLSSIKLELEQIGFNKSEIKIYLGLLKIGPSSSGPIIKESKTANSKVYEVLEKLIQKGMVSHFMKENVKYYKATNPKMLLNYLEEKKLKIEKEEGKINKLLPSLLALSKEKEEDKEAVIFSTSI